MIRSVGIVGHGAFGALTETLIERFVPSVTIRIHSSRHEPDGARFFSLADVAQCDAVILSVPIRHFEETLSKVAPLMREDAVIVDVATVKVHTVNALKRLAGHKKYIATHPMWGPESYKKKKEDIRGFRMVVTESTISAEEKTELLGHLRKIGFDVVEMTSEEHDRHLAESLFLTHFVGQIVSKAGFNRGAIDTISFGFLMDAMESVRHDTQLFEDVFRFNPYCKDVIERFERSEKEVRTSLEK